MFSVIKFCVDTRVDEVHGRNKALFSPSVTSFACKVWVPFQTETKILCPLLQCERRRERSGWHWFKTSMNSVIKQFERKRIRSFLWQDDVEEDELVTKRQTYTSIQHRHDTLMKWRELYSCRKSRLAMLLQGSSSSDDETRFDKEVYGNKWERIEGHLC